jgi:hypothetical protein
VNVKKKPAGKKIMAKAEVKRTKRPEIETYGIGNGKTDFENTRDK